MHKVMLWCVMVVRVVTIKIETETRPSKKFSPLPNLIILLGAHFAPKSFYKIGPRKKLNFHFIYLWFELLIEINRM